MPVSPANCDPHRPSPPRARRLWRWVALLLLLVLALVSIAIIDQGVFQTRQPGVATRPLQVKPFQ